ncbi:MAG TPA: molybdopterin-synthase adenylyltransferase MoeB [Thermoplasmata archaeon]
MARVTFDLPRALRELAGGDAPVVADGDTVGEALRAMLRDHPRLGIHLLSREGQLRGSVAVYRNDDDIRDREREATPIHDGDHLEVVASISGGSEDATNDPPFDRDELRRYSRHLVLPEVGARGQRRLRSSKVLLVGGGGLGSPAALYLTAAGVGEIGIVDFDRVELSNLQRQVLYGTSDVGRPKPEAAERRLSDLNPHVAVRPILERLTSENALDVMRPFDVVLDGSDNFATRYLVNDACVLLGKPDVYGSVYRFEGQVSVFDGRRGPCYRCLYPEPPPPDSVPSCAEGGVLGVLPGLIGTLQAIEAVKLLLPAGEPLIGRLLLVDALETRFRELRLSKSDGCVVCGPHASQKTLIDYPAFCGVSEAGADPLESIAVEALARRVAGADAPLLVDVRTREEFEIAHLPQAKWIPGEELADRAAELAQAAEVVVYCKSGGRSARAATLLRELGFTKVRNLTGGIDAWAERVDPTMPRY